MLMLNARRNMKNQKQKKKKDKEALESYILQLFNTNKINAKIRSQIKKI